VIVIPLALATAAAFSGAAAYINLSEQPARLALDDISLLKEWKPSYARGLQMQATLALASGSFGLSGWYFEHNTIGVVGGVFILANWPYTFLVIAPTNRLLEAIADRGAGPITRALIVKRGQASCCKDILGTGSNRNISLREFSDLRRRLVAKGPRKSMGRVERQVQYIAPRYIEQNAHWSFAVREMEGALPDNGT
jgi:hypothetical protein